jgi:hypothetical protein
MLTIPLTIVAASISAAVYMAFGWRPPEPKRVKLFFYEMQSNRICRGPAPRERPVLGALSARAERMP